MKDSKISVGQIVILLFLSRTFNVLNYVPAFNVKVEGTAMLYGTFIAAVMSGIILLPSLILYKKFNGENIVDVAYGRYKPLGYIVSLILFLMSLLSLVSTIVGFEYFMTNAVYENVTIALIVISMCLACFFGAINGIEGLSRASSIIFIFFLICSLFIGFGAIPVIDLINIKPILNGAVSSSFSYAFNLISQSPELYLFILLLPRINGNVNKAAFWFITLTFAYIAITNFLIIGVFSDYFEIQTFPYYTLASIVEISIFQRLDAIHMMIWVFVSFIRITLFVIITNINLQNILPSKLKIISMFVIFNIAVAASLIIGYRLGSLKQINKSVPILIIAVAFFIPLILLLITKRKERKSDDIQKDFNTVSSVN